MKHSLRYTAYDDGDSKSFKAVEKAYGDNHSVDKYECIGHYQKRLGHRFRKLRKEKNLGGKNWLVNKTIDTLQNYFGIALHDNVGNLDAMTTAIMASCIMQVITMLTVRRLLILGDNTRAIKLMVRNITSPKVQARIQSGLIQLHPKGVILISFKI